MDVEFLASAIARLHLEIAAQIAKGKERDARIEALEAELAALKEPKG